MKPFLKWAGGKRQLLPDISKRMPKSYGSYYEPFVGGGAVLFELAHSPAVINDINTALINVYKVVRDNPKQLMSLLDEFDNGLREADEPKEYYYAMRSRFNDALTLGKFNINAAALFIFVNKHCFNGLYRVNSNGLFNVPYNGSKTRSYSASDLLEVSKYLQEVEILNGDFADAVKGAKQGDFIFFDSPYAPLNPTSFEAYTKEGFERDAHIRLSKLYKELDAKGCYCMLTNHNTDFIRSLYEDFNITVIEVRRSINSDGNKRKGEEVIITNYKE